MNARYCPDCEEAVVTVRVAGKEMTLNGQPYHGVKLDQKPWARFLTGRMVEVYGLHDDAECRAARERRGPEPSGVISPPLAPRLRPDPEPTIFPESERR